MRAYVALFSAIFISCNAFIYETEDFFEQHYFAIWETCSSGKVFYGFFEAYLNLPSRQKEQSRGVARGLEQVESYFFVSKLSLLTIQVHISRINLWSFPFYSWFSCFSWFNYFIKKFFGCYWELLKVMEINFPLYFWQWHNIFYKPFYLNKVTLTRVRYFFLEHKRDVSAVPVLRLFF